MKIIWFMFQPLLCLIQFHDWVRGRTGRERYCEFCKREEYLSYIDQNGTPVWLEKDK